MRRRDRRLAIALLRLEIRSLVDRAMPSIDCLIARGFMLKDVSYEQLIHAIRSIAAGPPPEEN
jgi:hypothetical protein